MDSSIPLMVLGMLLAGLAVFTIGMSRISGRTKGKTARRRKR